MAALRSTPDQSGESAHQKELALDILAQIAHAFDFPDLSRFLNVCHCRNSTKANTKTKLHELHACLYIEDSPGALALPGSQG